MAFEPPAPRLGVVGKLAEVDMVIPSKVRREDELDCTIKNALGWEGEALRKESWGRMPPASEGAGRGGRLGASMLIYGACVWLRLCPWSWLRLEMDSMPLGSEGPVHLGRLGFARSRWWFG